MLSLDRETTASYNLSVKASDRGSPATSSTVEYMVVVEDANDNKPQFVAGQITSFEAREDQAAGEVLLTISAKDADTGRELSLFSRLASDQEKLVMLYNPDRKVILRLLKLKRH